MTRKDLTPEIVIAKIHELNGNVAAVARSLGTTRQTLYAYIKTKKTVQDALEESREKMIDNVESVLYSKALDGESWAVCFFLKTQAKHRGYVEKQQQEITGKDGGELVIKYVNDWRDPGERNG